MNRIRELRKKMSMTQKELANHLQIADSTLSYWEMGKYEPDTNALLVLSRFFNVPIDYILGGDFTKWEMDGDSILTPDLVSTVSTSSDIYVSEAKMSYKKTMQSTTIPKEANDLQLANFAFDRIEFADLTQHEIEVLAEYAAFIKSRRKSKK